MSISFSSSIRQRTVLGLLFVVLPLLFALISTIVRVDRLAVQMHETLQSSAKAVETSRLITNQVLNMERSAEQFTVLQEPELLARYENQRALLLENIIHLTELTLPEELESQVNNLVARESDLYQQLQQWSSQVGDDSQVLEAPPTISLAKLVRPIPPAVMKMVTGSSERMQTRIERVQSLLLWQAVALIPLAILAAVVFSVLITRPLKQITEAVKGLGSGDFSTAVSVSGPEDVRKLGEQLDWMRLRLAETDLQKQKFLQHVSHELKTPLTTLREGSELLRDEVPGALSQEQSEVVTIMHENSLQLQSQVEGLLNFNLALSQEGLQNLEPVDLAGLITEVLGKHQLTIRSRRIGVKTSLEPLKVPGVVEQLKTVIDNLLSNAIKYAPDHSEISIILKRHDDQAWLDVIDQGCGIESGDQDEIFKPFYQGKQTPRGPLKGTGLGLAIAQRYVGLHHGRIDVIQTGSGAHFRILLPVYNATRNNG